MSKMQKNSFEIVTMPPQNTNSVVVSVGSDCVIFDPWGRAGDWKKYLSQHGMTLRAIYSTHGHPDHISAAPDLVKEFGVPWYLHSDDFYLIGWGNDLLEYFGLKPIDANNAKPMVLDVLQKQILNLDVKIIETPGHTPGGVMYYFPNTHVLVAGDTVFQNSIGRYDLPRGNFNDLRQSVVKVCRLNLPDDTHVIHGHGEPTNIGFLRKNNPFFHE